MKRVILMFLAIICLTANAQSYSDGKHWHIEAGVGLAFGFDKIPKLTNQLPGYTFYAEGRYAFSKIPLTIGIQYAHNILNRNCEKMVDGIYSATTIDYTSNNLMLTCDYYFNPQSDVNLFAGFGVGICNIDIDAGAEITTSDPFVVGIAIDGPSGTASFMPRVGAVIYDKIRLTLGYKFQERANRGLFVTAGYVFRF